MRLGGWLLVVMAATPATAQVVGDGGSYLIGFRGKPEARVVEAAGGRVSRVFHLIPAVAARLSADAYQALGKHPQIEYIELDGVAFAYYRPNEVLPWGTERVGASRVWLGMEGLLPNVGSGCRVALLDTGIDYTHPDLAACYAGGIDLVNNDEDPKDDNGHGTAMAGLIAAADDGSNSGGRNSGYSVVGVAPGAKLYAVKVLGAQAGGSYSQVIAGLEWAKDNSIKAVCLGLGGQQNSRALQMACDACWSSGMLLAAATGNDGSGMVGFPARYRSVLAVAAVDGEGAHAPFSNYGDAVDLCGPGVEVLTTMPTYPVYLTTAYSYRESYDYLSGSSLAAAYVTGVAALGWARDNGITTQQMCRRLCDTAADLGTPGKDPYFGYGLVKAEQALR